MSGLTDGTKDAELASADLMTRVWRRTKDHRLAQWTVAYVGLAYAIQHAVVLTGEAFEWPQVVQRISMLLLVLGVPLVVTLAWYHGGRVNLRISGAELSILSVLVVIASLIFYVAVKPAEVAALSNTAEAPQSAASATANPAAATAVAVLPFVNLSSDKEQEFFSDGMTEEITSALAKVPGLRVVGRTSAFQYKGENKDLRAIGQALSATHLIEGSVRKEGNEVRITAQLIKADDGTHVWSESYDRELKGVFAVQDEIAKSIAGALRVPLGLKEGGSLVSSRTEDLESYQQYLRAKSLVQARGLEPIARAVALLEPVVAHDPQFAPAWALLAQAYVQQPQEDLPRGSRDSDQYSRNASTKNRWAESAAQQAIRLDPNYSDGYVSLGLTQVRAVKWLFAEELYTKALALDPNNPEALQQYSDMLAAVGYLKRALSVRQRLSSLEPLVPVFNRNTALILWLNGQTDTAIAMFKALPADYATRGRYLAQVLAASGRFGEAADVLKETPADNIEPRLVDEAVRLLRMAPAAARSRQDAPALGPLGFIHAYLGNPVRMLDSYQAGVEASATGPANISMLWHKGYAAVRKTAQFKEFVRKAGMVEYWRAKGWPEFCHPTTGDDFTCG